MDIRSLRYFVEVVQLNGFSRAAERLFVTQPAISRSIQKLEQELGYTLLVRENDGVRLTDEGEILLSHAKQILKQFNSMNKALKEKEGPLSGILNVGLPPVIASTYFADIIMAFSRRYPQVELKILELGTHKMMEAMLNGEVETAAVMLPFDNELFDLHVFSSDRLMLLVSEQHPLAMRNSVKFAELIDEPFIFFSEDFRINELVMSACGIYGKKPVIAGRSSHLDLVTAMVRAGVGVTLLPDSMWNKTRADGLSIIPVIEPVLSYEVALATLKNSHQSRRAKAWNALAKEMLNIQ
ncbi:TPA: LysR family transcriptional regulator [Providencia stuartii]|uniref:LysR family transcriptional regulator n=4 Tax=Enterobacterales TaxID=91347 RepID=A0AAJ1JFJ1_PROST|nr:MULTISPECIES: LysR family transcriptional regulator [Providencia]SST03092.1 LysR family transcriptional regulator [Acinetobacter baumannii]AFH95780.1 LysR family transcriptional regulator [Providencia stuartii MRSN 2154]AIN64365.1 bacterial regulatory helix-turn-helix, lysR family protein [Providencia stuartii]AMG66119.1 LysR family transcriptional regulator [Providencia stuartii]AVE43231.1 LysR family transcriptional regulator [Providencia stuartii]